MDREGLSELVAFNLQCKGQEGTITGRGRSGVGGGSGGGGGEDDPSEGSFALYSDCSEGYLLHLPGVWTRCVSLKTLWGISRLSVLGEGIYLGAEGPC